MSLILNWIADIFIYGERRKFVSFRAFDVELNYTLIADEDNSFRVEEHKLKKTADSLIHVNQDVVNSQLIITDSVFRKKFKRDYKLMKFVTEDVVLTFGSYKEGDRLPYLVCTIDFINLLVKSERVIDGHNLFGTEFEPMAALFDKSELAKFLIKA
jgi:hypothetical protein